MERINYMEAPVTWRLIETKTKKGTTSQWQAVIRFKVQTGTKPDGTPVRADKRKSKLFPPSRLSPKMTPKDNATRFRNALNEWKAELEEKQAAAIELEEQERLETERVRRERELEKQANATTVASYVNDFIDMLAASKSVERSTLKSYRGCAKHIAEAFSDVPLSKLTGPMIQKWEAEQLEAGYSTTTVTKWHRMLSEACKHAVNNDILPKNPCTGVRAPKRRPAEPNSLTSEGYARLAHTLDLMEPSSAVVAACIALHTGLRCGEICGIRWREYDRKAKTIHVCEAIGNDGGDYVKKPKTLNGIRDVPVNQMLATMLDRRLAYMIEELETMGMTLTESEFGELYIIGTADGRFASPTRIERDFKGLSDALGLVGSRGRRMTMHGLRDSFATNAIAAGSDVRSVAGMLGHSNPSITLNVYSDALPEAKRRATDLLLATVTSNEQATVPLAVEVARG